MILRYGNPRNKSGSKCITWRQQCRDARVAEQWPRSRWGRACRCFEPGRSCWRRPEPSRHWTGRGPPKRSAPHPVPLSAWQKDIPGPEEISATGRTREPFGVDINFSSLFWQAGSRSEQRATLSISTRLRAKMIITTFYDSFTRKRDRLINIILFVVELMLSLL